LAMSVSPKSDGDALLGLLILLPALHVVKSQTSHRSGACSPCCQGMGIILLLLPELHSRHKTCKFVKSLEPPLETG
jgi:hypothetical protein